jgi:hypothetical protein
MAVERETWLTTFDGLSKMFYCTHICKDKKADKKKPATTQIASIYVRKLTWKNKVLHRKYTSAYNRS